MNLSQKEVIRGKDVKQETTTVELEIPALLLALLNQKVNPNPRPLLVPSNSTVSLEIALPQDLFRRLQSRADLLRASFDELVIAAIDLYLSLPLDAVTEVLKNDDDGDASVSCFCGLAEGHQASYRDADSSLAGAHRVAFEFPELSGGTTNTPSSRFPIC